MSIEVKVPTLGESVSEATVGQWLKKPGEAVALDEPIASLETDKVAVDVPAPAAGILGQLLVQEGDTVSVGALIADRGSGQRGCRSSAAAPAPLPRQPRLRPLLRLRSPQLRCCRPGC
jgi:2-oxoglutarate dehydrogenase E2 component (dihydrolipoamide succinyltransferase)